MHKTSPTAGKQTEAPSAKKAAVAPVRDGLPHLHHAAGNQAFGQMLNAAPAVRVGPSGSPLEREAHAVSRQAGTPGPIPRPAAVDGQTGFDPGPEFSSRLNSGGGTPLENKTRDAMENRFGADFSRVRVHSGSGAEDMSRSIGARAFTHGSDIYLGVGEPASPGLLAHELTHVVQQSGTAPGLVQRFESDEHQRFGDMATGSAAYDLGNPNDKFELTHGDIVALSGDVFEPDELFRLAAIPGNQGQKVGSRDEILWALQDSRIWELRAAGSTSPFAGKKDARFQPGGPFANFAFSDAVKKTVFNRYRKLGAANAGHFAAPQGRDAANAPLPAPATAGATYRDLHEAAIRSADKAGRAGAPIGMAMAREAAAQHFLTDLFSAGHLRTPIGAIREYWGNKYPLFWYHLRHKIALDTAIEVSSFTNAAYNEVLAQVEALAPSLPAVTLGDLLGSVFHDVDNERGVNTGPGTKVFGDKHVDPATEKLAVSAIKAGNKDIAKAYDLGKQMPTPVIDTDLFDQVKISGGGTVDKYVAELLTPSPDVGEPPQNWKATDFATLWNQKLLGAAGDTVGQEITRRVQGGAIAVQLNSLAENFPENGKLGTHPRAAYLKGFVRKLQADPKTGVLDIINWAPHGMGQGNLAESTRDSVNDLDRKGKGGDKKENLSNMTLEQRTNYVNLLIANKSDFDKDAIATIFSNTPAADRPELYKRIEGHPWASDFKRNKGDRDRLYELMMGDPQRVDKLKNIIDGAP